MSQRGRRRQLEVGGPGPGGAGQWLGTVKTNCGAGVTGNTGYRWRLARSCTRLARVVDAASAVTLTVNNASLLAKDLPIGGLILRECSALRFRDASRTQRPSTLP